MVAKSGWNHQHPPTGSAGHPGRAEAMELSFGAPCFFRSNYCWDLLSFNRFFACFCPNMKLVQLKGLIPCFKSGKKDQQLCFNRVVESQAGFTHDWFRYSVKPQNTSTSKDTPLWGHHPFMGLNDWHWLAIFVGAPGLLSSGAPDQAVPPRYQPRCISGRRALNRR